MAQIYNYNGRQVYDSNGQTYDAKTGQVVQKTSGTQTQQTAAQQPVQQQAPAQQQQTYQQPAEQSTGQRQYVQIQQDAGGGATGEKRFFERRGDQLVPVTDPDLLRRLDASQILFDTERRQINFQDFSQQQDFPSIDLEPGNASPEVEKLQNWLIKQGFNIPAGATGYYGQQTKAAVEQWQRANGVEGGQNFGFWGPKSRQAAQSTFQEQTRNLGAISALQGIPGAGLESVQKNLSGLPPQFQELYKTLSQYLQQLQQKGLAINPNIEITPDKIAQFLRQAENEISPYYKNQLKIARESFLRSVGYTSQELVRKEQELERQYGRELRGIGESAAEIGFAQSGRRIEAERELAEGTQREIEAGRRQLSFQAGTGARQFAQQFGGLGTTPTIGGAPRVLAGQAGFQQGGGDNALYEISPDVYEGLVGEQEFARRGAVQGRSSQLEEAFRSQQAINQQRVLQL